MSTVPDVFTERDAVNAADSAAVEAAPDFVDVCQDGGAVKAVIWFQQLGGRGSVHRWVAIWLCVGWGLGVVCRPIIFVAV